VLSANPLTVLPEELWDLEVVETIKDGKTISTKSSARR
jgi:predicted amidohydrolase YtcJ